MQIIEELAPHLRQRVLSQLHYRSWVRLRGGFESVWKSSSSDDSTALPTKDRPIWMERIGATIQKGDQPIEDFALLVGR